jgi:hypothetical protein
VELEAVNPIEDVHFAGVRSYLRATGPKHGLSLSFAKPTLPVKRVIASLPPHQDFLVSRLPWRLPFSVGPDLHHGLPARDQGPGPRDGRDKIGDVKKPGAFSFQLTRDAIEAHIGEMERKMDRLRSLYESFFMGMERIPPDTLRRELNRLMLEMQQVPISSASLRFRFQAMSQKWVLHTTYWNRTMREIEAGTYRRDVARAQRHLAERSSAISEAEALALGIPRSRVKAFVAHQQRLASKKTGSAPPAGPPAAAAAPASPARSGPPPLPPGLASPAATPASLPGLSNEDFEGAYQHYVRAHRELGIEAQALAKEKLRARLGKQLPKVLGEQQCERVRLEIAVEEGKVRLRAWAAK